MDKKPKGRDSATGQQKQNSINQRSVETKRVALKSVCDKKKELEIEEIKRGSLDTDERTQNHTGGN